MITKVIYSFLKRKGTTKKKCIYLFYYKTAQKLFCSTIQNNNNQKKHTNLVKQNKIYTYNLIYNECSKFQN